MSPAGAAPGPAEPAAAAALRRSPRPRAGAELPDRLQHPRGDRARGRAGAGGRRARGRRRPRRAQRVPGRARRRTCTWSRSTSGCGRRCEDALAGHANVTLCWADAMRLDLARWSPRPARWWPTSPTGSPPASSCARIEELPTAALWVVMVQREVGERLAAAPGQRRLRAALGARPARLRGARRAGDPPHRLLPGAERRLGARCGLTRRAAPAARRGPGAAGAARAGGGGFAHRRKTLAGSLRSRRREAPPGARASRCGRRSTRSGSHPDVRAERLSPEQFLALARSSSVELATRGVADGARSAHAGAGEGQPRAVRGARPRRATAGTSW